VTCCDSMAHTPLLACTSQYRYIHYILSVTQTVCLLNDTTAVLAAHLKQLLHAITPRLGCMNISPALLLEHNTNVL
jgi:hypothetical protein